MNSYDGSGSSKFIGTWNRLLKGFLPHEISSPYETPELFWSNLLLCDIDRDFFVNKLDGLDRDYCLGSLKPVLNSAFWACLTHIRMDPRGDGKRSRHAVNLLMMVIKCILAKNLTGWEVMEVFAGGVNSSDKVFMELTSMIDGTIGDSAAPADYRHQVLQLANIFMCSIGQMSPGAYFLQRDLFPSIVEFIKSPETKQYTFEAVLLLATLANFHKSDAAKLNPYLQRLKATQDRELMRIICWACNFAINASVKAYQEIWDDAVPTLTTTLGSVLATLRSGRAMAPISADPFKEAFKAQPIEACVILLPVFEFIQANDVFVSMLLDDIIIAEQDLQDKNSRLPPAPFTLLTLSSYLLSHATSASSPRPIAYADLCLKLLLAFAENDEALSSFCRPSPINIRICRQRSPLLPHEPTPWPPVCALMDCCVLWLRHNLHNRLEVASYATCIWICHRVIWFIQKQRIRLDYHWKEFWNAIIGLLAFLSNKLDNLVTTGGVEQLVRQTISVLDLALCKAEVFLPRPESIHEFIYELVRSSSILKQQAKLVQTLSVPRRTSWTESREPLAQILLVVEFYEEKIGKAGPVSARQGMQIIASEIDAEGLFGVKEVLDLEAPPKRGADVLGFARVACLDILSLMP